MSLTDLTARQLLDLYAEILNELNNRNIIRTRNSPVGDLGEWVVWNARGGELQPNSNASYDIKYKSDNNTEVRVQVKSRVLEKGKSSAFSTFRRLEESKNFDLAVFLVFDPKTYDLILAKELSFEEVKDLATKQQLVNGFNITINKVRNAGRDVLDEMIKSYEGIDS